MDSSVVSHQLSNSVIRQGLIYLRTDLFPQWQQIWGVLTNNYLFIFRDHTKQNHTDYVDLGQVNTLESYLRKEEDLLPSTFKIKTKHKIYYFSLQSADEKWSWIVTLQRLMDYKLQGSTHYNSSQAITNQGFKSQNQYQLNKKIHPPPPPSQDDSPLQKQIQRLKLQLQKQEKHFQGVLKDKYKQLNAIEEKMIQRQMKYEELTQQLLSQNAALQEIHILKGKVQELNKHLHEKLEIGRKHQELLTTAQREISQLKVQLAQAKRNQNVSVPAPVHASVPAPILPLTNHIIKSYYKFDMVESLLGFPLSKQAQSNLLLNTNIIEESSPKHPKANHTQNPLPLSQSQSNFPQKQERKEQSPIVKELTLQNTKLEERLKDITFNQLNLRKEIQLLKTILNQHKISYQVVNTQLGKKQSSPSKSKINSPSKEEKSSKVRGEQSQTNKDQLPLVKPSWVKQSSKNDGVPVWVTVRPDQEVEEKGNKYEVQSPKLAKKESGLVNEMKKIFQIKKSGEQQKK